MSDEANKTLERKLHRRDLSSSQAPAVIGLLVVRQLIEYGQSSVYIDDEGFVAVASPGELALDGIPEEMAINTLVAQEWNDDEVVTYLRGRDARLRPGG